MTTSIRVEKKHLRKCYMYTAGVGALTVDPPPTPTPTVAATADLFANSRSFALRAITPRQIVTNPRVH